ncbi:hypothetical protein K1719_024687 [Acacia pycnantha]|nr:hypothetical protein K1719_024687 [Acacia pycnantha]
MEEAQISDPLVWKEVESERVLVGKVLARKSYLRSTIEAILRKAWNLQEGFDVIEVTGNAFMFRFSEEEDYCRILRGRLWSINSCVLNLVERSRYSSCEEFDFSQCPVWIQIHNVPMEAWCLANVVRLGGHVGEVILAEDPVYKGRYLRNFLRARVVVDLRKSLANGFWLPRPDGRKVWLSIKYEKLQSFCYNCGKVGHDNWSCSSDRVMLSPNSEEPRFGAWLSTTASRTWDEMLTVVKEEGSEARYVKRRKEEASRRKEAANNQDDIRNTKEDDNELFSIKLNQSVAARKDGRLLRDIAPEMLANKVLLEPDEFSPKPKFRSSSNGCQTGTCSTMEDFDEGVLDLGVGQDLKSEERNNDGLSDSVATGVDLAKPQDENPLAVVLFDGNAIHSVLVDFNNLGLKRKVDEEWESMLPRRRKILTESPALIPAISTFASNLRKTKVRMRRNSRKKEREGKENIPTPPVLNDEVMKESGDDGLTDSGFIFRASGNRKRLSPTEGSGGCPLTATKGSRYTWCNNRPEALVRERLDRALGNVEFRENFAQAMVFHIDPIGSDHHTVVVDCCHCEGISSRTFKFEANWTRHIDFLQVVKGRMECCGQRLG